MINLKRCVLFVCGFSVLSNNLISAENNNQAKEELTLKQKISQKYKNIKNWVSEHKYKVILSCVGLLSSVNFVHTKYQNFNIMKDELNNNVAALKLKITSLESGLNNSRNRINDLENRLTRFGNANNAPALKEKESKDCAVCFEESDFTLSCHRTHKVCKECIKKISEDTSNPKCPLCRKPISLSDCNAAQGRNVSNSNRSLTDTSFSFGRW